MSLESEKKCLARQIDVLNQKLGLEEQKAVEVQKDLLKCKVDRQTLAAEMAKMREDSSAALHEANNKHTELKELNQAQVSI